MDASDGRLIDQALQNTGAMGNVALDAIIALCEELRISGLLSMEGMDRMERVMVAAAQNSGAEALIRQRLALAIQDSFRMAKGQR